MKSWGKAFREMQENPPRRQPSRYISATMPRNLTAVERGQWLLNQEKNLWAELERENERLKAEGEAILQRLGMVIPTEPKRPSWWERATDALRAPHTGKSGER